MNVWFRRTQPHLFRTVSVGGHKRFAQSGKGRLWYNAWLCESFSFPLEEFDEESCGEYFLRDRRALVLLA